MKTANQKRTYEIVGVVAGAKMRRAFRSGNACKCCGNQIVEGYDFLRKALVKREDGKVLQRMVLEDCLVRWLADQLPAKKEPEEKS